MDCWESTCRISYGEPYRTWFENVHLRLVTYGCIWITRACNFIQYFRIAWDLTNTKPGCWTHQSYSFHFSLSLRKMNLQNLYYLIVCYHLRDLRSRHVNFQCCAWQSDGIPRQLSKHNWILSLHFAIIWQLCLLRKCLFGIRYTRSRPLCPAFGVWSDSLY